jgi:hypothetical protein
MIMMHIMIDSLAGQQHPTRTGRVPARQAPSRFQVRWQVDSVTELGPAASAAAAAIIMILPVIMTQ